VINLALPRPLHVERVPIRVVLITGAISYFLAVGAVFEGFPLWGIVLAALLPWIPMFGLEAIWKYEHYGFYAFFAAAMFLQLGHLAEHATQVGQLLATHGDLTRSRGVFGQLDFEDVHFVWDTGVWLSTCLLLYKFTRNKWLWISFIFASLHEIEHIYLFYIVKADMGFYQAGGLAGIMGLGGVIGSPLPRPYLHFSYNFLVVIPMLVAFWDQTREAFDKYLAKALPKLSKSELIAASQQLRRQRMDAGDVIVLEGDPAERFYIVSEGEVEMLRKGSAAKESRVALLGPGKFFGEIGLMTGEPQDATVRATKSGELLVMERDGFNQLLVRSQSGLIDLEADAREREKELAEVGSATPV